MHTIINTLSITGGEKCYSLEGHLYCRARECNAARVHQWYKLRSDYEQEPGLILLALNSLTGYARFISAHAYWHAHHCFNMADVNVEAGAQKQGT